MQIASIDLERHWFTIVIDENFIMRNEILFSANGNWHFMYNFLSTLIMI
jgi:hypothetical protein